MTKEYRNFINGEFASSTSASSLSVLNPSTNETLARVPSSDIAEVDAAVASAREAQLGWERLPAIQRANYLRQISKKVREHRDRLAELITREQGKVLGLAQVEVDFTADYIDYMAEWARRIEGEVITSDRPNETILLLRKPIGVVAGILPWNFPFFLIARKLAPALVTGNTIVIKPSEETPLNAFEFAQLVAECDLPPGVFNLIGGGRETGAALAGHRGVDLVSFTGSVGTGVHIMRAAAENLTRVNLELGGKAPAIVLASADLDLAANAVYQSRILNTGQVCNCAERVYVERSVAGAFTDKVVALMKATTYGDPLADRSVSMGPLISAAQLSKVSSAVEQARKQGAQVVLGGRAADRDVGHHYEPTVLADCSHEMDIMRTETFGPVLPIQTVDSLDEAVKYANDSEYGLTSSIFTNDLNAAMHACRELKFGETYVNREHFEAMQGFHAGRRKSGIGGADGKHGLYEYMETQAVYLQTK
ncbi:aldehyde dehydrogenase [Variovorax sp. WS11]|uniref:aldehyde dehydrogenase n=1 Tax=Variovorax sp. WS11 TaxID=1105204 RepID=UPI000D0CE135|nr:aldehyde dehydrogenase [Variovorax sp. WS11]NDZ12732.1 aldehyde dehydrogenase [Variovorax sp. WS11]PSL84758.1 aldehyde dehydrogenase [Variovorax sp. WS11]